MPCWGPRAPPPLRVAPASSTAGPRLQSAAQCPILSPSYVYSSPCAFPSRGEGEPGDAYSRCSINVRCLRRQGGQFSGPHPLHLCADRKGVGSQSR